MKINKPDLKEWLAGSWSMPKHDVKLVEDTIDAIVDSIGSCGECKHLYKGWCYQINQEGKWVKSNLDWYCADFERKEE